MTLKLTGRDIERSDNERDMDEVKSTKFEPSQHSGPGGTREPASWNAGNGGYHRSSRDMLDELNRQARQLRLLEEIRAVLLANSDLTSIFHAVINALASNLEFPLISFYLLENGLLKLKAQHGYDKFYLELSLDKGINGLVARTGQGVLLPDVTKSSDYLEAAPGVTSLICVPLVRQGNEVVGTLAVESTRQEPLDQWEYEICRVAAEHMVLALEQNNLHRSEQRRADQLAVLNKIGRELVSMLDVSDIIERITGPVRHRMNYYSVNVGLIEENDLVFTIGVGEGNEPASTGFRLPLGQKALTCYAARNGELVLVHDVTHDSRYLPGYFNPETKSEIVLPLRDANRIIGVLDVQSQQTYAFDDDEVILLKTLADQTSIALANALRFQDIRRQKEELARANRALEEANRLKNEFLANVSHELRTPLNSIMGYVDMIQSEFYGPVPESFNDPLERVERNSRRLLSLINDVLDLSKLEAGREHLQLEKFSLPEVVRFTFDTFKEQAASQNLSYICEFAPDAPRLVDNDQKRVMQIISNLLSNAIKFTSSGEVRLQVLPAEMPGGIPAFQIKIIDTGIGIARENFQTIFESFRQVDGSTTRLYGGTGLGLTLCQKLTRMMQGFIEVESELGKGSIFTVTLPVTIGEALG